jgi:GNAT superfamily N-acetyltransferase
MESIQQIQTAPPNLADFVSESADGIGELFGARASGDYRNQASAQLEASLAVAEIEALAVFDGADAIGLSISAISGETGVVSFMHVLASHSEKGIESDLLLRSVEGLRKRGVRHIVSDFVPLCPLDLKPALATLDFDQLDRAAMVELLPEDQKAAPRGFRISRPARAEDTENMAQALADGYAGHIDTPLHPDLGTRDGALAFVQNVSAGAQGAIRPEYIRVVEIDGGIAGVLFGAETLAGVGFILHVVVRPPYTGRGFGSALLNDARVEFARHGMNRFALTVSTDNPALHLYERLGLVVQKRYTAFTWSAVG